MRVDESQVFRGNPDIVLQEHLPFLRPRRYPTFLPLHTAPTIECRALYPDRLGARLQHLQQGQQGAEVWSRGAKIMVRDLGYYWEDGRFDRNYGYVEDPSV